MNHTDVQIIFGLHPVIEAVEAGKEISKVLLRKGMGRESYLRLAALLYQNSIPMQIVPEEKLNRVTRRNHQGVIAYLSPVEYAQLEQLIPMLFDKGINPFIVVCDGITDTGNIGAIARSAVCAGAHALLMPVKGTAMISADTVKASAGALHHLAICRTDRLKTALVFLKNSGLKLIAATEKTSAIYHQTDLTGPAALLMGAEDTGISPACLALADVTVKIPLQGKINSLNVASAAAILMFEMLKQNSEIINN
ncbi:MAG: 23S rRNA (guanosine(2251)-2'-O)-methyltransferase RlmB [Bacteroidales bacterium]|jgi:23S rRNA (guanosine2251-2'-O)-methyltransferase|nr:23S rRNA (guanosine(2251)-2'-O)-methyltransferase RlmB [Bacteroidales bacterium]